MDFPVYIQGFKNISKSSISNGPKPETFLRVMGVPTKKLDSIRVAYVSEADKFQILRAI